MSTVEQRFQAATDYVRRAIATVERAPSYNPFTFVVERYAGSVKTEPVRNELGHIEDRWLRATNDLDRARVARDAELLADRTQESLPGAPQDRARTNLFVGESPTATPPSTYGGEFASQAELVWDRLRDAADDAATGAAGVGKWLLVGGGLLVAVKLVDLLRSKEKRQRQAGTRALNRSLVRVANRARPTGWQ